MCIHARCIYNRCSHSVEYGFLKCLDYTCCQHEVVGSFGVLNLKCPECTREELDSNGVPANARSVTFATYKDCIHRVRIGLRAALRFGDEFSDRFAGEYEHISDPPYRVCPRCARQEPPPEYIWFGLSWNSDAEHQDGNGHNRLQAQAPRAWNCRLIFCPGEDSQRVLDACRDAAEVQSLWPTLAGAGADADDIIAPVRPTPARVIPIGRGRHHDTDDDMDYTEKDAPPHYCAEPGPVRPIDRGRARHCDSDVYAYPDEDDAVSELDFGPRRRPGARAMPPREIRRGAPNDVNTCPYEDDADTEFDDPEGRRRLGVGAMRIRRGTLLMAMGDEFIRPHGRLHGTRYRPAPRLRSRRDRGRRQFDEYDHEFCDCYDCQLYH